MKTSTTFPYRSKSGKRSSAVVPSDPRMDTSVVNIDQKQRDGEGVKWEVPTEADVENEKGVGIPDVRRSRSPKVRHDRRRREKDLESTDRVSKERSRDGSRKWGKRYKWEKVADNL
ncbi:hypothetical protein B296_00024556 [Ensete ventricosum]|uniref:Uncharacterized protein n=1 Tax=Ensete ventricosum TaxID=4639 RepID=A0A427AIA9_ENSVE|nr:hypothetical protein B296_00024556 [Ensete ventricosum]